MASEKAAFPLGDIERGPAPPPAYAGSSTPQPQAAAPPLQQQQQQQQQPVGTGHPFPATAQYADPSMPALNPQQSHPYAAGPVPPQQGQQTQQPYPNQQQQQQQPGAYPQQQQQQPQVLYAAQPQMANVLQLHPARVVCSHCNTVVTSVTHPEAGLMTYLASAFLCLVCFPLACVPCCVDGCQDVSHTCPNCKTNLGTVKRM
ncbi:hypothetical protein HKX48_003068 [Thoreauomyces humboldtii]|nr:hypothetical protein HKX48_003068 [Thoreauomyces humboldtii]